MENFKYLHAGPPKNPSSVLVRTGSTYVGTYHTLAAAKKALAKHLQVSVSDLPRRGAGTTTNPRYRNVYVNGGAFEARTPEGAYLGRFSTEVAAVQALGAEGHCAAKKGRSQRETAEVAIRRFEAFETVWRNWLPADMAHQVTFRKEDGCFARAPGPLYCIAVLGKEPTFRNLARKRWDKLPVKKQLWLCLLSGAGGSEDEKAGSE